MKLRSGTDTYIMTRLKNNRILFNFIEKNLSVIKGETVNFLPMIKTSCEQRLEELDELLFFSNSLNEKIAILDTIEAVSNVYYSEIIHD